MSPPGRPRTSRRAVAALIALAALTAGGCKRPSAVDAAADAGSDAEAAPAPTQGQNAAPVPPPPPDKPMLGVTAFVATVYKEPRDTATKLGYLRVGAKVARSAEPAGTAGCPGGWYEIYPKGFICAGKEATLDLEDPILKAAGPGPNLRTALPYRYAFVRAVLPLYLRAPTAEEQTKAEFKLKEHLEWFEENKATVQKVTLGANDVAIDDRGVPLPGKKIGELGLEKNSLELGEGALLGGQGEDDPIPFWLEGGKRLVPNISDFEVPDYAVFADRARRFTGLSLIGSFALGPEGLHRRFAITTDLRLAPNTKLKPDTGSPWHGVELSDQLTLPLAFVRSRGARSYEIAGGRAVPGEEIEHRAILPLTGKLRRAEGVKYYRTRDGKFVSEVDVGIAVAPSAWPEAAEKGEKWIEISLTSQTLVLWEGKRPVYATLVSTGQAGVADPKTTTATIQGAFRIRNKHITATMDSNESTSIGGRPETTLASASPDRARGDDAARGAAPKPAAPKAPKVAAKEGAAKPKDAGAKGAKGAAKPKDAGAKGAKGAAAKPAAAGAKGAAAKPAAAAAKPAAAAPAGAAPVVPKKGDGEYGVTKRRGEGTYKLRDVPYIQYFASGYALHAAYWHDVFGTPRSHGCVNLSPIDAHRVFLWTEPSVPAGWHAINTGEELGEGTMVIVHE